MIRSISTTTERALADTLSANAGSLSRLARHLLIAAPVAALTIAGSLITAGPASALDGLHINGTWNVRNTPTDSPNGTVSSGQVVTVDCQADGPSVTVAGFGTSAIWDHIPGRGYVSDLAVIETTYARHDPRIPTCGTPTPTAGDAIVGLAGKCVDVRGAQTSNGTPVQLYDCNNSNAQKWTWSGSTLRSLGKCLDIAGGGTANGTRIQLWDCNGTGAQSWQTSGQALRNPQSGRCLDVPGANPANGNQLIIWDCHGGTNQAWRTPGQGTSRTMGNTQGGNSGVAGNCTFGAMEKFHAATGYYPLFAPARDAREWAAGARTNRWTVVDTPDSRSIVVFQPGVQGAQGAGHVAWVDSVETRSDGIYVHITEMNGTAGLGNWDQRTVKHISGMSYILAP